MDEIIFGYNLEVVINSQCNGIACLKASVDERPLLGRESNPWQEQRLRYVSTKVL